MSISNTDLAQDIQRIQQIPIIPTLLDVICATTGMGFAAVTRVTDTRWITCRARDDIQFGLVTGSELPLVTTICNEIKASHEAVIIDNVKESQQFYRHHTPALYGFQSYISFPILLKNGVFFGTLCAIDPSPADLNNPKIRGLFTAFADLISFHLQQADLLEQSSQSLSSLSQQLTTSHDENRQYHHLSYHTLQEPLRKLSLFSSLLMQSLERRDLEEAKALAIKIDSGAQRFSSLIKDLPEVVSIQVKPQN